MDEVAHDLPDLYSEHLPDDMRLVDHPADDEYVRGIETIKARILSHSRLMPAHHVRIIKQVHKGVKTAQIAADCDCTPSTVLRVRKTPAGLRLLAMLAYLASAVDAPRDDQRRHVLWRIVKQNAERDPRVAISAIAELNRMSHNDKMAAAGFQDNKLEIIINNQLPRGALD